MAKSKARGKAVVITPKVKGIFPSFPTADDIPKGEFFILAGHLYQKREDDECLRVDCGNKEYADDFSEVATPVDVVITWKYRK